MNKYYVYAAYGVSDELLYIGKGSGSRLQHCVSGTSSSRDVNRYFFQNGETGSIKVKILKRFETEEEALKFELHSIVTLNPLFNKNFSNPESIKSNNLTDLDKLKLGINVDFCRLLKQYIRALEVGDTSTIKTIEDFSEEHKRYVEVLGVAKIKAVGFHKTKLTNAYNLQVKFNQSNQLIKESLKGLRVGNRYTIKKVLEELKSAYSKAGVKKKPVSTDVKNYFNVKNAWLIDEFGNRCKGYEIISDLYKEDFY